MTGDRRAKDIIDAIYQEACYVESRTDSNDPNSKRVMEQESRKRALAHMGVKDRIMIEGCATRLKEAAGIGDSSAMQILMHLGIILSEREFNGRK